ncbi:DMT family transporter [Marinobacter nanhaiticus D15-8W]|uniref:DMT family transporter n=1 Tax=Marinobacter nanhaiticus D15-8W TaxID=626887 RepID=N6VXZ0_9GAMM|nr:DMT family transporter [Marinobacter nanhaiticus]ENO15145.1 DMT family transporter [Marinobacter nanhaiticus D15-8W]BES69156.1 DMT family transporter [Marinobacter nanhaiticus D15-8W]
MSGRTVNSAILLLVIGNAMALISDVFIKLLGSDTPVFQFVFLRCVITLLLLLPLYRQIDGGRLFEGLGIHTLRAHIHLVGISAMVLALGALPLATANAIFYAAPVLVMVFSVLFVGARLDGRSVFAVVSGFVGIVVILRPVEINWMALSALVVAASLAINALLVPQLPDGQSMVHKLFLNYLLVLPAITALMLWENAPWDPAILLNAIGSSVFILGYNITVLLAYRQVQASQVTSAEYTGLIWAVLLGWFWFGETPDLWFLLGSSMIVVPLILIGLRQHRVTRKRAALVGENG